MQVKASRPTVTIVHRVAWWRLDRAHNAPVGARVEVDLGHTASPTLRDCRRLRGLVAAASEVVLVGEHPGACREVAEYLAGEDVLR